MTQIDPKVPGIEEKRLELDHDKLAIEAKRLGLEGQRLDVDNRFLNRHLGVIVTGIVSLAAVGLSWSQLLIASANRQADIEIAQANRTTDIEIAQANRMADIEAAQLAQQRQWGIQLAEFVFSNRDVIFGGETAERETMRDILLVTYPPEVTAPLFQRLEKTTPPKERAVWQTGVDIAQSLLLAEVSLTSGSSASIPGTPLVLTLTGIDAADPNRLQAEFSVRSQGHQEMAVKAAKPGDSFAYQRYQIRVLSVDATGARFSVGRQP